MTGSSFSVSWSSQFPSNQISVVVQEGPKVLQDLQVRARPDGMVEVRGLDPGVLYTVTAAWHGCGGQGSPAHMSVRTGKRTCLTMTEELILLHRHIDWANVYPTWKKNLTLILL